MTAKEVREKYINFFKSPPRSHIEISPSPLVLEDDPTTLFTSAGMQPLVPFLMGEKHPDGLRLVDSQPSIRLQDIEEVGDNRHTTFFEMLGNWSLGDYFKAEQLPWIWDFLTKDLKLDPKKLYVTVYKGDEKFGVKKDMESVGIWKEIFKKEGIEAKDIDNVDKAGMGDGRIFYYSENWWSMTGNPAKMNVGHIGGPDSEVFYEFTDVKHDPKFGDICHPNDDCGRFFEIGNSVFIQYKKVSDNKLEELPQKNVDFGGGLERITAAVNNNPDIFKTDLFSDLIRQSEKIFNLKYGKDQKTTRSMRIVTEHLRASAMLISSGVLPGNKTQGYVLRRLLRKALFHLYILNDFVFEDLKIPGLNSLKEANYPLKLIGIEKIEEVIKDEMFKFASSLRNGVKILQNKIKNGKVDGLLAFDLYQTNGVPFELTLEILESEGLSFTREDREKFEYEFEKHKELSRTTSAGVFKGGLADHSLQVIKLHTATHLLLASLRKVLGEHVVQKGQNITKERGRFDFPNPEKLSEDELKKVEDLINEVIRKDLPVKYKVMSKEDAEKTGAIHAFNEKYADTVKVYFVGENIESAYSKEFCGGPHVEGTGEIGHVRISKQEKIGSGLLRVYVVIDRK